VVDAQGRQVATPEQAEAFADQAVARDLKTRSTAAEQGGKNALYVRIPMVANFENKQAEKYKPAVEKALRTLLGPVL
jgi:membrane-bound lytic murein transglycosylase C